MFHEMPLKLYFMKCSETKVSQCAFAFKNAFNKCVHEIEEENLKFSNYGLKKNDSSTPASAISEIVVLLFFVSFFISFGVCGYAKYFFDAMRNQTSKQKYILDLIKRRSKDSSFNQ